MNLKTIIVLLGAILLSASVYAADAATQAAGPDLDSLANATPAQIKSYFQSPEYTSLNRTDGQFMHDAYRGIFRRQPDPQGLHDWLAVLQHAKDQTAARTKVVDTFLKSPEYQGLRAKAAAAAAPKEDTTRNPANVLFDKTGMFVNNAAAFPADVYAPKMKLAHVAWIAIQIDNGGEVRTDNTAEIERGWAAKWRREGFKVGFWGCPRGITQHGKPEALQASIPHVQSDAALAVKLAAKYHADLYLADCEDGYQGYNPQDPAPALNRVYVEAFHKAAADAGILKMPRALSSMGRIALDMKPWIDDGWDAMPQAYWNSYAVYQPSKCVDFYLETGWPIDRIHPTIATYRGEGENREVTLAQYAKDLKTRNTVGFSFYLPESYLKMNDAAYREIAEMGQDR